MKSTLSIFLMLLAFTATSQTGWQGKFEQMGNMLPTPNQYRTGSGEPGPSYWQQKADYKIKLELDDENQKITGSEVVTYYNNSPSALRYLWVQLDQNVRQKDNLSSLTSGTRGIPDNVTSLRTTQAQSALGDTGFDGGFKLMAVKDTKGNDLDYVVNFTMMKINLPEPLETGDSFSFNIDWWYNINDRGLIGGRSGYEYFKEDDNYLYTIAQFYPRMAVYDDFNGWQNKQFIGSGEFALTFGDFEVEITVPSDHIVASTGELQNPKDVLTSKELQRYERAKESFDKQVFIVTEDEAKKKEKSRSSKKSTWVYHAENVRDFAFASSRKFIWDAQAVKVGEKTPLAMSYYPKEGNPLWERESTKAVINTLINYSEMTIDYPYPVAISVHAASIGMEYPMICFNFGRPRPDGTYNDFVKTRMVSVIVHEVGHNYFPMIINSDERQWAWMDEGLDSFMEYMTMKRFYPDLPYNSNTPEAIIPYMKGSKDYMRPIMTNPEQSLQLGPEAYSKPSAALVVLREEVMGPELFDAAFKEYSRRWAFKHPKPADFFRTMEDASAVDLDWFWKGWFFSTDNVDVEVADVKWFKIKGENKSLEGEVKAQAGNLGGNSQTNEDNPFYGQPQELSLNDDQVRGEYRGEIDNEAIKQRFAGKNVYQITFKNNGGLITPITLEWTYKDGSKEIEKIPAEIWRRNEAEVTKLFVKDKEVDNVVFDPFKQLGDVNTENNSFPQGESRNSRFDQFKKN
ncbi:M1 family metallopeptidase [Roseivirga spongicola]|uniref:M1 family metallopeptidase n=1 Tax=Roseivirga spongicola TaxID=333140 RepID=UPI002AC8D391|nr:M1 family metallopeptidase [Roseivirga spongicola]WPZ08711.1 M1 family metallopeptidase [Roseivirga spongicola]